jgi:Putative metallopeptidase
MICATEASLSTTIGLQTVLKSGIKTRSASIALRLAALAIIGVLASAGFNDAVAAKTKSKNVHIHYVEPSNPIYRSIYDQSKELRVLEYVQELLLSIRLPRPLTLKLTGCDGVVNAWYGDDEVAVCYEFVAEILKNAPEHEAPAGITRQDAIAGSLLDVFLHESGHAVFDMLSIPLFGREEDAADQFSAYIMLQYDKARARKLILGNAYQYKVDIPGTEVTLAMKKFSDEHGIPAQRFYNVLCIAYGADPKLFADVVEKNYLPRDRADGCEDEYRQISFAFKTLIGPHIDRAQAKRALKRRFKS